MLSTVSVDRTAGRGGCLWRTHRYTQRVEWEAHWSKAAQPLSSAYFCTVEAIHQRDTAEDGFQHANSSSRLRVPTSRGEEKRWGEGTTVKRRGQGSAREDSVPTGKCVGAAGGCGLMYKEKRNEENKSHFAIRSPVDGEGCFTEDVQVEGLAGLNVLGAGEAVLIEMLKRGNLFVAEVSAACCWAY